MDLRKLRKFIKENKNLSFVENTTETEREFIIEQKESKYKLKAILTEKNTKCKFILENAKNLVVEEYETTIENNDDMINKVKDAVALYDMIDDIDETSNLDIDQDFKDTIPNSIEDEVELTESKINNPAVKEMYKGGDGNWIIDLNPGYSTPGGFNYISGKTKNECLKELNNVISEESVNEELLIDQPQDDQEVELVEKTKREKECKEDYISNELEIVDESLSNDFNERFAIKTNGGYVKLINNNNSYQIVESAESATYSSDKEEMKSQLIKLAKQENRPLKAGKIVDLNEVKAEEENKLQGFKDKDIEITGNKPSEISSTGSISESKIKLESLNGTEEIAAEDALYSIKQNKITDKDRIEEIVRFACHKYNEGNAEPEYEDEEFYEEEADFNVVLDYVMKNLGLNESVEIKIEESEENEEIKGTIKEASKLINDALKIIKKLYNEENDGTTKTILGSIDLNIQIPQGQIDELVNIMK